MKLLAILLLASPPAVAAADPPAFFATPPLAPNNDPGLVVKQLNLRTFQQRNIPAVLATVENPVGFVHVFTAGADGDTCSERVKTSETADSRGCAYAVNGGPFDMNDGSCVGDVVSNGTVVMVNDTAGFASWGLGQRDGAWEWVFGNVNSTTVHDAGVVELVSGFIGPLLVSGGVPVPSTYGLVAARTAVGIDAAGRLLLLTIDGAEDRARGMNITELGIAFAELGAVEALNLDGGGSTVAWMAEEGIVDRPTCDDHLNECERAVATVICVMPPV